LNYRNIWVVNTRNFGDSDHHDSLDMEDVCNDIARFMSDKKITMATVGGHGYGAKVASAFGSYHMEKTTGVVCLEGGPLDNSYHEAWEEVKNLVSTLGKIDVANTTSAADVFKKIDATNSVKIFFYFTILFFPYYTIVKKMETINETKFSGG
jgi:pimeloyl-ACP methyl ester carboxylesterase